MNLNINLSNKLLANPTSVISQTLKFVFIPESGISNQSPHSKTKDQKIYDNVNEGI